MGRRKKRLGIPDEDIMAHCVSCGALLTTETGVLATPDWYKETRFVHYCKECQKEQFEDYTGLASVDMAFYLCCAAYNLPFVPEAVPSRRNVDGETWETYLENLKMLDQDVTDSGDPAAFSDGLTDLSVIFDGKVPSSPTFAGGLTTGGVAEKLEGTRAQRKNWGLSYKTAEYKELDRLYGVHSKDYEDNNIIMTATLTASGWSNLEQTVTVTGVSADPLAQAITPTPNGVSREEYNRCEVNCVSQGENSLTFSATSLPTEDRRFNCIYLCYRYDWKWWDSHRHSRYPIRWDNGTSSCKTF